MNIKSLTVFILLTSHLLANVGFDELRFYNEKSNRNLITKIWYPTIEKEDKIFAENIAFKGFIAKDAGKIKKGKHPLIIFFHGTSGNWKN